MSSYTLEAIIKAVDKVSGPMKKMAQSMAPVTRQFQSIGKAAGNFGGNVGKLLGPVAAIGSVASVTGIAKMTQSVANYGDTIANTSRRVGWSAKALQEYSYAANFANMTSEEFQGSLDNMSKRMGQLRARTGPLVKGLNNISPVLRQEIKDAKNNEEAFSLMMKAIQAVDDPNRKRQLAELFFGDKNMIHFADLTAEQLEALSKEANLKGLVLDDEAIENSTKFNDSLNKMKKSLLGVSMRVGSTLLPVLVVLFDKFTEWLDSPEIREGIDKIATSFTDMLANIDFNALLSGFQSVITGIGSFVSMIGGVDNAIIGLIILMNGPLIASFLNLGMSIANLVPVFGSWLLTFPKIEKAYKALSAVFVSSPIGLILTGITLALVGLAIAYKKNLGGFADFINKTVMPIMKLFFSGFIAGTKSAFSGMMKDLQPVIELLKTLLSVALKPIIWVFSKLSGTTIEASSTFSTIGKVVSLIVTGPFRVLTATIGIIATGLNSLINFGAEVIAFFVLLPERISGAIDGIMNSIKSFFDNPIVNGFMDLISKAGDFIFSPFEGMEDMVFNDAAPLASAPSPLITGAPSRSQAEVTLNLGTLPKGSTVETHQSGDGMDLGVEYGYVIGVN